MQKSLAATIVVAALLHAAPVLALSSFVTFETGHVRPLALTPDGTRLLAVNTPDNRLEIFDVDAGTGALTPAASVPVGMEPAAVAARTNDEAWVVNHLSDSVSIVDLSGPVPRVVRTLHVGDEPRDIVFAGPGGHRAFITTAHRGQNSGVPLTDLVTPGVGRADVWVFDATDLGTPLGGMPETVITLFGDTPRPLAVSPDGGTVYAGIFHSGNRTTTVSEGAVCDGGAAAGPCAVSGAVAPGGLPAPSPFNCAGVLQPETGLIVRHDEATDEWRDELGRDWSGMVRFDLLDRDVFVIDALADPPTSTGGAFTGVGTVLFNMAVNPVTGSVYVSNTEARNEVRFEGPGGCSTTVQGRLHEARVTVLDGGVSPRHLNKHIDYGVRPAPAGVKDDSLATPLDMVVTPDGATLYVAAFGSSKVGVIDTLALETDAFVPDAADHIPVTGGGPSGLALAGDRLYVLTRFDNGISTIDTTTGVEIDHLTLFNPEPPAVVDGRPVLYDAVLTSSNGEASCASCHVFGDFDSLAWDLGNPDDGTLNNPNPVRFNIGQDPDFAPLKGPMTTQSLRGMANHGPMHWRGDRTGGNDPGGNALDENQAFLKFIVAFEGLLGNDPLTPVSPAAMQQFADFILEVAYPPNPIRSLDNSLTPAQQAGRNTYFGPTTDIIFDCNGCHVLNPGQGFFGSDGFTTFENEPQLLKIPHLRNAYQKVGMFGMPAVPFVSAGNNGHLGPQVRGFGYLHDGSIDTVFRFLGATVFSLSESQQRDLEQFVLAFDSTLAPVVGQQVTLTAANATVVDARIDLLIDRARTLFPLVAHPGARECDLVVKGTVAGEQRGWLLNPITATFAGDRAADAPLSDGALRALAATPGQELTYTCTPPGSGVRMGIDRDEDGVLDGDEDGPPAGFACQAAPADGCRTSGKSVLLVKDAPADSRDRLVWKWLRGEATAAGDFGDPTAADGYELCLYDADGVLVTSAGAPAGGTCDSRPCWKSAGTRGFRYRAPDGAPDGLGKVVLKSGSAGKAAVIVKGRGEALALPSLPLSSADLPYTIQLQAEHGGCWSTTVAGTDVRRNDVTQLKAKVVF